MFWWPMNLNINQWVGLRQKLKEFMVFSMNNEDFLQIFPSTNAGRKKIELRHTYGTLELDATFKCIQHIGTLGLKWVVNFTMPSKVTLEKHGKSVNNIPDPESGKLSGSFGTRFLLSHAWFPGTCTDLLQLDKWWNYQHLSRYIWITIYIYLSRYGGFLK